MANKRQRLNRKALAREAKIARGKKLKPLKFQDGIITGATQTAQSGHASSRPGKNG